MTKTERKRREIAARKLKVLERRLNVARTRFLIVLQDSQDRSEKILSPFFGNGLKLGVVDDDGMVYNNERGDAFTPEEFHECFFDEKWTGED